MIASSPLLLVALTLCQAFLPSITKSTFLQSRKITIMKDKSSANVFEEGNRVKVIDDVEKSGVNLKNRIGIVNETWVKCDVDPTCCCAEFVDDSFAVRVLFETQKSTDAAITSDASFLHYFAERELVEVKEEAVAFDGLSCTEFKLNQLKMGEQAKRIAKFEESKKMSSPE
eukprot:CAMPEP_0194220252 /NCGR_PEP_ID=MMETSP0156-20130528/27858_1 /TAXON_ID=33649 /ORGANISM="Thalassionema nitzschioides, Strain L26-B" /LENGTH=170 /DNA_ID=CAMNT_0038950207 /DNA_START=248 /DNA_END=760 /DNA_ORIENTATION=-